MWDVRRFTAGTTGRVRVLLGVVIVGAAIAVSVSALGAGTASARSTQKIPYWNTMTSHQVPHFDDGCECYSGHDTVFDGFDRSYDLFPPDNVLRLSPPLPTGPKGAHITAIRFETFGSTHIKELHKFQLGAPGQPAKFKGTVKAPAGVNGATVSTQSSTGTETQVVTWSKNGVPVGSPVLVDMAYYLDFAAQQTYACANGLLSPPIAVVATIANADGTSSAGRPVLESCTFKVTHTIKYTK